jgi:hypothetical protein
VASEQFGNAGHRVAVIKTIDQRRDHGLQLVSAWVLPIYDDTTALGSPPLPPSSTAHLDRGLSQVGAGGWRHLRSPP